MDEETARLIGATAGAIFAVAISLSAVLLAFWLFRKVICF